MIYFDVRNDFSLEISASYDVPNNKKKVLKKIYKNGNLKNLNSFFDSLEKLRGKELVNRNDLVERLRKKIIIREEKIKSENNRPYAKLENLLSDALNKIAREEGYFDGK